MQSNNENLSFPNNDNGNSLLPIISLPQGVQVVDSRLIAEGLGIQHKNFLETIQSHQKLIEKDFGAIAFETREFKTSQGNKSIERFAFLNEAQATFLGSLSRNTAEVVAFKSKLVKSFFEAKKKIEDAQDLLKQNPKSTLEMLAEGFAQMAKLEKDQLEQAEELKALQESQDATAGKLHHVEAKITNLNNDFYSLAGYYGLRGKKWDLSQPQSQQTGKKLKKISTELGYDTLSVNDARYGAVRTYHIHVLQTVLGF